MKPCGALFRRKRRLCMCGGQSDVNIIQNLLFLDDLLIFYQALSMNLPYRGVVCLLLDRCACLYSIQHGIWQNYPGITQIIRACHPTSSRYGLDTLLSVLTKNACVHLAIPENLIYFLCLSLVGSLQSTRSIDFTNMDYFKYNLLTWSIVNVAMFTQGQLACHVRSKFRCQVLWPGLTSCEILRRRIYLQKCW